MIDQGRGPRSAAVLVFWPVLALILLIFLPSSAILIYVGGNGTALLPDLGASGRTPWGILTSFFAHSGWNHLMDNLQAMLLYSGLFILSNIFFLDRSGSKRVRLFVFGALGLGVGATALWVILKPDSATYGSSGLVYAVEGLVVGFALHNSLSSFLLAWDAGGERRPSCTKAKCFANLVINLFVFLLLFAIAVQSPILFLNAQEGVNAFVHGVAFYGGFLFGLINLCTTYFTKLRSVLGRPHSILSVSFWL